MKQNNAGFSLIEVLIAIVVLGILVVPFSTGLQMAVQINARANDMLQAQLDVSSAVETLMANGITPELAEALGDPESEEYEERMSEYPNVTVTVSKVMETDGDTEKFANCYDVTVVSNTVEGVKVQTVIRHAEPEPTEPAPTENEEGGANE